MPWAKKITADTIRSTESMRGAQVVWRVSGVCAVIGQGPFCYLRNSLRHLASLPRNDPKRFVDAPCPFLGFLKHLPHLCPKSGQIRTYQDIAMFLPKTGGIFEKSAPGGRGDHLDWVTK
ncbi:hypothetical protein NBRC116586_13150 [Pseudooceanicola nitratireducens]